MLQYFIIILQFTGKRGNTSHPINLSNKTGHSSFTVMEIHNYACATVFVCSLKQYYAQLLIEIIETI